MTKPIDVPNIGQLVDEHGKRDAIHIAVIPVIAGQELRPGEHVGILYDQTIGNGNNRGIKLIGIVDPFLTKQVYQFDKVWLFLYPGSITSLRHVWTHPAFQVKIPEVPNGLER